MCQNLRVQEFDLNISEIQDQSLPLQPPTDEGRKKKETPTCRCHIQFSVNKLAQFMNAPTSLHWMQQHWIGFSVELALYCIGWRYHRQEKTDQNANICGRGSGCLVEEEAINDCTIEHRSIVSGNHVYNRRIGGDKGFVE